MGAACCNQHHCPKCCPRHFLHTSYYALNGITALQPRLYVCTRTRQNKRSHTRKAGCSTTIIIAAFVSAVVLYPSAARNFLRRTCLTLPTSTPTSSWLSSLRGGQRMRFAGSQLLISHRQTVEITSTTLRNVVSVLSVNVVGGSFAVFCTAYLQQSIGLPQFSIFL